MKSPRPHKGGYGAAATQMMMKPKPKSKLASGPGVVHCDKSTERTAPNTRKGFLTFCNCCKHLSVYLNEGYGSAECLKPSKVVIDFVRGERGIVTEKCFDKNTYGMCKDFVLKKSMCNICDDKPCVETTI